MEEFFIYTIGKTENFDHFQITDIFHVKDKKEKNVSICKLNYDNKLFLVELPFLKVIYINNNEIHLELNDICKNDINNFDEKICESLENIINLPECKEEIYDKITELSYSTIIKNNNYIKLFIDNDTNIQCNKKNINIDEIKVNDMIQLCFLIESINIYPELNISGTKTSCKMINLHKEYKPTKLKINDFNFTYNETEEFEKPVIVDQDIDFFNTLKVDDNTVVSTILKETKKRGRKPKKTVL
jgi:hypothetical protein